MNIINKYNLYDEAVMIPLLKAGDMGAYEAIYNEYWPKLYGYVYNRLQLKEATEEIIQEVFFSLWIKHEEINITHSLSAYLYAAVRYQVFNYIKSDKVRRTYAGYFFQQQKKMTDNSNEENMAHTDLMNAVEKEVSRLPEKCQQVFRMSRNEHLSVSDIATILNISHKTVENHLTKALRHLRIAFGHHICLLILISAY